MTALIVMLAASATAYTPSTTMKRAPFFVNVIEAETATPPAAPKTELSSMEQPANHAAPTQQQQPSSENKNLNKSKTPTASHGKEGIFSPLVSLTKEVLGEKELNEIRAKAISMHSDVIGKFVATAESSVGYSVLKALFTIADRDRSGTIEEEELREALIALGFDLKPKQISGIFQRADADENGALDFDEWRKEAPKTLRTNLIKLAKKNGGELGFLA